MQQYESDVKYDRSNPPPKTESDNLYWVGRKSNEFNHWRIKSGVFQFTTFTKADMSLLEWGDSIQESHEKGVIRSVNRCSGCGELFLHWSLILVPYYHDECKSDTYDLVRDLFDLKDSDPDAFYELIGMYWIIKRRR